MDLLKLASDAAEALEKHGYTACGRKRDGVVTLDCFGQKDGHPCRFSFEVGESDRQVDVLVARVLATVSEEGPTSRAN